MNLRITQLLPVRPDDMCDNSPGPHHGRFRARATHRFAFAYDSADYRTNTLVTHYNECRHCDACFADPRNFGVSN